MSLELTPEEYLLLCRQKVKKFAHNKLGSIRHRVDTSDIAQEACLQLLASQQDYNPAVGHDGLFSAMAKGHSNKQLRNHSAQCRAVGREEYSPIEAAVSGDCAPDEDVSKRERDQLLVQAIETLDQDKQYVIYRRFFDDASIATIARELEITDRVCRRMYDKAMKQLLSHLGDC